MAPLVKFILSPVGLVSRKFQWGVQAGVDWKAFKHLKVHADLNWGLNDIFNKDFKTVTFDMYAIYLNVGFGYAF